MLLCISIIALIVAIDASNPVQADVWVNGYTRKDGTYVEGHYRSDPDGTINNNWSVEGNINPYTGVEGTKDREPSYYYSPNHATKETGVYSNKLSGNSFFSALDTESVFGDIIGIFSFLFMSAIGLVVLSRAFTGKL